MKQKKIVVLVAVVLLAMALFGACGGDTDGEIQVLVGATAIPHAEILAQVAPVLYEQGIHITIVEFDDFIQPNIALAAGDIDINYFQHLPFLNNFNENHDTDLVPVFGVHFEPLRLYAGRLSSLEEITSGTSIAIPDDPTNEARALQLLEYLGLIRLPADAGLAVSSADITYNPHDLQITPIAANLLAQSLPDVDFAVINANFALLGGVIDLAIEGAGEAVDSPAAIQFTNYVVVRAGDEDNEVVQALVAALNTDAIRDFISNEYRGRVVPTF